MRRVESQGWVVSSLICLAMTSGAAARGQIPGLPTAHSTKGAPGAGSDDPTEGPVAAPTKENPKATVAASSGPIEVNVSVRDQDIMETLGRLLPRYPGVRSVDVSVENGLVTLEGQVADGKVHDNVSQFVRRVEGVRLILNGMKTDEDVLTAPQLARREVEIIVSFIARKWLVIVLAMGVVIAAALSARFFRKYSEVILAPFVGNPLLQSVIGSTVAGLIATGGVLLALTILDLTQAVLSILGLAGVVGLAVGFAFKDITENFIASVLLGVRRPFRIGDVVQVANQTGVVKSLNTRATVLVTMEGNHVRIPNAVVFKEIMINRTASNSVRSGFDVTVPHEASTAMALEVITNALTEQEGLLQEPSPRALVQDIEPGWVLIRTYFWVPAKGVDGDRLRSDLKLKVKVALQRSGIRPPTKLVTLSIPGNVPVQMVKEAHQSIEDVAAPISGVSAEQARANLLKDSRAARAEAPDDHGRLTPVEHALEQPETQVSSEGKNLIADADEGDRN